MSATLGIDPGIAGAWALLECSGQLVAVGDLPVAGDGALAVPLLHVAPQTWKRHFNLPAEKEAARQRAIELWPGSAADLARKCDHGRAEAALIGLWGVQAK
jgi:hypothetical protein